MKKFALIFLALALSICAFPQKRTKSLFGWYLQKDAPTKLDEVKINLGSTIFGLYPEISYERILNEDFSIGTAAGISLDMTSNNYPTNFSIIPYARWFFGGSANNLQKYGAGFFIEANAAIAAINESVEGSIYYNSCVADPDYVYESSNKNIFGAGLGLGIGWKYLSKNNWIGEFMFGIGRDFVNDGGYVRSGITIGRRF